MSVFPDDDCEGEPTASQPNRRETGSRCHESQRAICLRVCAQPSVKLAVTISALTP
jgi:hypothetical protein